MPSALSSSGGRFRGSGCAGRASAGSGGRFGRVSRRIAELGLAEADAYRAYLEGIEEEWDVLAGLCRVTISRFWRDRAVFEGLRDEVLPELGPALSAWSAGCASGEEPYSLVLAAAEARVGIHVIATDVDPVLLRPARGTRAADSRLRTRAFGGERASRADCSPGSRLSEPARAARDPRPSR